MNPIENVLNEMVAAKLPEINALLRDVITGMFIDPWGQPAYAEGAFEREEFNPGTKEPLMAHYAINEMRGLSTVALDKILFSQIEANHGQASGISGTLSLTAGIPAKLSSIINGSVLDTFGFIATSYKIEGTADVTGGKVTGSGTFSGTHNGGNVCLNHINVNTVTVSYGNVNARISCEKFNYLAGPVTQGINNLYARTVSGAIAGVLRLALNDQVNKILPLCKNT